MIFSQVNFTMKNTMKYLTENFCSSSWTRELQHLEGASCFETFPRARGLITYRSFSRHSSCICVRVFKPRHQPDYFLSRQSSILKTKVNVFSTDIEVNSSLNRSEYLQQCLIRRVRFRVTTIQRLWRKGMAQLHEIPSKTHK